MPPLRGATWAVPVILCCLWSLCVLGGASKNPQAPTFRSRTTVVPIDVRVLDRGGQPVTDLTRDDFIIIEDGVRQEIRLFEHQTLAPVPTKPGVLLVPDAVPASQLRSQQRRVFLIILGRLWLPDEPFGTTKAVTRFIRERLLPQDYVAVSALNRATAFTTDHDKVAQVVERLENWQESFNRHYDIEVRRRLTLPETQAALDDVFQPGSSRTTLRGESPPVRNLLDQIERQLVTLYGSSPPLQRERPVLAWVTGQVLDIASGIQYLRYIEGEKRLIYLSTSGLWLPSVDDDKSLARIASDARVVLDVIQTGGLPQGYDEFGRPGAPRVSLEPSMVAKHVTELTGGRASWADYPEHALARIDVTSRSGYLLGYYPTNPTLDGKHRKLEVIVKRPSGATLLFRHGYLAQDETMPYDFRRFVIQDRMVTAAGDDRAIGDIGVTLTASAKEKAVSVEAVIDPQHLSFDQVEGRRVASLDIAFFCSDAQERNVGELWQTLDLNLGEGSYQRSVEEGLRHRATVPVKGTARYVKVVVYCYPSDRTGTSVVRLR